MNKKSNAQVDINSADIETLSQLPGIGPDLAGRIKDARPFESVEDLTRVDGIGPSTLERLKPLIYMQETQDNKDLEEPKSEATEDLEKAQTQKQTEPDEEISIQEQASAQDLEKEDEIDELEMDEEKIEDIPDEAPSEATIIMNEDEEILLLEEGDEGLDADIEVDEDEITAVPAEEELPQQKDTDLESALPKSDKQISGVGGFSSSCLVFSTLAICIFIFVLAVGTTLGIQAGINNGQLRYTTIDQYETLELEIEKLNDRIEDQQVELESLRKRIDNLDGLAGKVDTLDKTVRKIDDEVTCTLSLVDKNSADIEQINAQIDSIDEQINNTKNFFQRLRELLDEIYPMEITDEQPNE